MGAANDKVIKLDFGNSRGDVDDEKPAKKNKKQEEREAKMEAEQAALEQELIKINNRYKRLAKSIKTAKSDSQTNTRILKYCLQMSVRLLPIAEETFLKFKNERAIYGLKALVDQNRELMSDIRQMSNNDATIDFILNQVVLPSLQMVLAHQVAAMAELKTEILNICPPKKAKVMKIRINNMLKDQGKLLTDTGKSVENRIRTFYK